MLLKIVIVVFDGGLIMLLEPALEMFVYMFIF